jgi:heme-degrading monooxygenase HmoA
MVARVTLAEIDSVRMSVGRPVKRFEESVLPELREQPGYEGAYVLTTPEGKALVVTFWADDEAAAASIASGSYRAQVEKVVTLIRSAPGRETYDVDIADVPQGAVG